MCERRTRKIKKGSQVIRLRESRRLQRMQRVVVTAPPAVVVPAAAGAVLCPPPVAGNNAQCRLILELALKTVSLMQKNSLIQQKIIDLQRETSEYVASVMNHPENKRRYMEHIRVYGSIQQVQLQIQPPLPTLEPKL